MPHSHLPLPGRPQVLLEASGETDILALDAELVTALYKQHGALLLRGFGADMDGFSAFARQFSATAVVNESPGRTPLDPAENIYTVDGGGDAFSLHPELSREPWKPDVALFGCLSSPGTDGATTICDGIALVRALPAAVRHGLEGRRLCYMRDAWPALLDYWLGSADPDDALLRAPSPACPYRFTKDSQGRIYRYFTRPALHKPMFADAAAFGNFLLFARFNNNRSNFPVLDDLQPVPEAWLQAIKAAGDAVLARVEWQKGDVLMLDNTRFMHGRTAIKEPGNRLIATYFGYLRFAIPDPEEPVNAVWRRGDFAPPLPPGHPGLATAI